jgi:hypothetical protein
MFTVDQPFKLSEKVQWGDVGGEVVLLDTERETFFSLNEISSHVWKYLSEGRTLNDVLTILEQEYDVDPMRLRSDVMLFVDSLAQNGLVGGVPR